MKCTWLATALALHLDFGAVAEAHVCTVNFQLWNRNHIRNDGVSWYYYNVNEDGILGCEAQRTDSDSTNNLYSSGSSILSVGCPVDSNDQDGSTIRGIRVILLLFL